MELAERLKIARDSLGKEQKEIASLLSISFRSWQDYEAGKSVPGGKVFEALVKLGFNANWLLTGEGEMRREAQQASDGEPAGFGLALPGGPKVAGAYGKRATDTDPVLSVVVQELFGMTADQRRAVLKFCMDINGDQYALAKYSSQENREKRIKG